MYCIPLIDVPELGKWQCQACGVVRKFHGGPITRLCGEVPQTTTPVTGAGTELSKLLESLGIVHTPDCQCKEQAARMDNLGPAWSLANIDVTIDVMREEAEKRGVVFVESQARWLIELAIALAEERREPSRLERTRLQAMKIGNLMANGRREI